MPLEFFKGMGVGAGLIIAIGAQNAFVLSQGIRKEGIFLIPLVCSLCDAVLIFLGIAGIGTLVSMYPAFLRAAAWGGAAFLFWYGIGAFRSVFRTNRLTGNGNGPRTMEQLMAATLALTLLNPHVYLDTVVLVGSIGAQFPGAGRIWFGAGAAAASVAWFFSLSLGGTLLAPVFGSPRSWKVLDLFVGVTMWSIAGSLILT